MAKDNSAGKPFIECDREPYEKQEEEDEWDEEWDPSKISFFNHMIAGSAAGLAE